MEKILIVTTEVNDVKVVFYGKIFLEYPKKENHRILHEQAREIVSKLTGISTFSMVEAGNYTWNYEDYNEEIHKEFDAVDLLEIYEPRYSHSS